MQYLRNIISFDYLINNNFTKEEKNTLKKYQHGSVLNNNE